MLDLATKQQIFYLWSFNNLRNEPILFSDRHKKSLNESSLELLSKLARMYEKSQIVGVSGLY
jgi:hypothetical protein